MMFWAEDQRAKQTGPSRLNTDTVELLQISHKAFGGYSTKIKCFRYYEYLDSEVKQPGILIMLLLSLRKVLLLLLIEIGAIRSSCVFKSAKWNKVWSVLYCLELYTILRPY